MVMKNKKGVSAVIATVLIILITVATITILWQVVIPMVENSALESSVCVGAYDDVSIVPGEYTCYTDNIVDNASITIKRNGGSENLNEIVISILTSSGSNVTRLSGANLPSAGETKVVPITPNPALTLTDASVTVTAIMATTNSRGETQEISCDGQIPAEVKLVAC